MHPLVAIHAVAAGLLLVAAPAANRFQGTFKADGREATLTHGLAWVDGPAIAVGFFSAALDDDDEQRAMVEQDPIDGVFEQPNVQLWIHLKKGAARPGLAAFEACGLRFRGFPARDFDGDAEGPLCGPVELSGALKPGGVVHGRFKGQTEGTARTPGDPIPVYSWDLSFTATLRDRP